jgi:alanine racemase
MRSPESTITFRPRLTLPEETLRPTRAEIDLGAIAHNLAVVREVAAGARVLSVVKADAYGHGMAPVAQVLEARGVDGFGVALAEEGLELREGGVNADILVLNGVYGGAHADVLAARLTPVVYDLSEVDAFAHAAADGVFEMHLKVDTGMSRLGVSHDLVEAFLEGLDRSPGARIAGVMTHLAAADTDPEFTTLQLTRFDDAVRRVRAHGHRPTTIHAANTAGTFLHPASRHDLVRTGISLYGYAAHAPEGARLRPAMRLRTEVIAIRDLAKGATVGYDRTYCAPRSMRLATVPMGYGDGLMRQLGGRGAMLVGGVRCPIVGRVSMDLTTLDISGVEGALVGDEAVVLGTQGDASIDAVEVAEAAQTIAYEILTNVSRRVPRVYRNTAEAQ